MEGVGRKMCIFNRKLAISETAGDTAKVTIIQIVTGVEVIIENF